MNPGARDGSPARIATAAGSRTAGMRRVTGASPAGAAAHVAERAELLFEVVRQRRLFAIVAHRVAGEDLEQEALQPIHLGRVRRQDVFGLPRIPNEVV